MNKDEYWIHLALEQARKAEEMGEVPVGAILVKDNHIIERGGVQERIVQEILSKSV